MMQELDAALGRIHAAAAGRTGGGQPGALHEAGSPAKARKVRRSARRPPKSREQRRRSPRREP
jgi:hypothetical protein